MVVDHNDEGADMSWKAKTQPIKIGDKVAYSKAFLKSIGAHTGDLPFARGTVTGIVELSKDLHLAEIDWGNPEVPDRVNVRNLCCVKDIGRAD